LNCHGWRDIGFAEMSDNVLRFVEFFDSDGQPVPGLVPIHNSDTISLSMNEQAAVSEAKLFDDIDFIFFRRFSDGRSSQVAAYVIDNSDERLDKEALGELHLQVWLHGKTPLLYIAWPGRVDILTCARGPDFWIEDRQGIAYKPVKEFKDLGVQAFRIANEVADELQRFSALRLADGTFWEEAANRKLVDYTKAAHKRLIQAIVEADNELDGVNNPILRQLLLLMVLIKYLEDRSVFPNGWFGTFHKGARSFFEVLQGGAPDEVYRLLHSLESRFNGDIFVLPSEGEPELTRDILLKFARLVEAKTLNKQRYLWRQFSFKHLPVEIISHLYQRFVKGGKGVVYTPPLLVSLLLDYAMPYENLSGEERILDPACGSGVFLVGAFRRLINVWRYRHGWQLPDVKTLKGILKRSIYGVELDAGAVGLTTFSLCLAVCDALQPDVIWQALRFDRIRGSNLFEADFFDILLDQRKGNPTFLDAKFDLVIGNPPFQRELSRSGMELNRIAQREDGGRELPPGNQSAYLFMEQAFTILDTGCQVCLIQPHGLLYNRKAHNFRSSLFRKHKIEAIYDFISIRKLYDEADTKTIAVLAQASAPPDGHWIRHFTFRRTASVRERICFELDLYDRHRVSQEQAQKDFLVWRVNLLGGGRLLWISQRLRRMRTLSEYIDQKAEWDYGEGFIVAKTVKRDPAPFFKNMRYLPTTAFTGAGIDKTKIDKVNEESFRSAYTEKRYTPPLLLVKASDSLPIAFWDEGPLAYRAKIVGIHAPRSQRSELWQLYETLQENHDLYRFACTLNGTQSLAGKATAILKQDIDILPYPEDKDDLSLSFWEKALCEDVLKYMAEYVRLGQNSALLRQPATVTDLREYSTMFCRMLGSVYDNLQASDPVFLSGLICQPFYFGEYSTFLPPVEDAVEELRQLVYFNDRHANLRTIRVLRFYIGNSMLLIKPDRLRYWIRATAIRDADETLHDLRRQGY
jgi:hypothetical protein